MRLYLHNGRILYRYQPQVDHEILNGSEGNKPDGKLSP